MRSHAAAHSAKSCVNLQVAEPAQTFSVQNGCCWKRLPRLITALRHQARAPLRQLTAESPLRHTWDSSFYMKFVAGREY